MGLHTWYDDKADDIEQDAGTERQVQPVHLATPAQSPRGEQRTPRATGLTEEVTSALPLAPPPPTLPEPTGPEQMEYSPYGIGPLQRRLREQGLLADGQPQPTMLTSTCRPTSLTPPPMAPSSATSRALVPQESLTRPLSEFLRTFGHGESQRTFASVLPPGGQQAGFTHVGDGARSHEAPSFGEPWSKLRGARSAARQRALELVDLPRRSLASRYAAATEPRYRRSRTSEPC